MDSQFDTFNVTYCVDTKVNNNLFENTGTGSPELCAVRFFSHYLHIYLFLSNMHVIS